MGDVRRGRHGHGVAQVTRDLLDHAAYALGALLLQRRHQRTAHAAARRAQRQGLEHVHAALDGAVHKQRCLPLALLGDLRQHHQRRYRALQAAVVMAHHHALHAAIQALARLHPGEHALDEEGQLRGPDELRQLPGGQGIHAAALDDIIAVATVEGMVGVDAHRQGAVLLRMADLGQHQLAVSIGLDDLDHRRAGGDHALQLRPGAHAAENQGIGLRRALGHGCHAVRVSAAQVGERRRRHRRGEGLAKEGHLRRGRHRVQVAHLHQQRIHIGPGDMIR